MKKQIIKAAKLFYNPNTVLPILERTAFTKEGLVWTDLEVTLSVPFKSGIEGVVVPTKSLVTALEMMDTPTFTKEKGLRGLRVQIASGKDKIGLSGRSLDEFPANPHGKEERVGTFEEDLLSTLEDSILFQSADDLRPAMTYTYVDDHIVATDAHRLMFVKMQNPLKRGVFVHEKVIKLMNIFGGDWSANLLFAFRNEGKVSEIEYGKFTNSNGVVIIGRQCGMQFPNWKGVIPEIDEKTPVATLNKKEILKAIKNGKPFANRITNQGIFKFGETSTYNTADFDFDTDFKTEIGVSVPKENAIEITFNSNFIKEILDLCGDTVKMNYWTPTKAAIFDGKYLCLPILMNT